MARKEALFVCILLLVAGTFLVLLHIFFRGELKDDLKGSKELTDISLGAEVEDEMGLKTKEDMGTVVGIDLGTTYSW